MNDSSSDPSSNPADAPDAPEADRETARDDLRLVGRALAEVPEARQELARRLECAHRFVRRRNERMGKPLPPQDLPDLVHDALAVVWRKLPDFEGRARLETWVFRICNLELMNAIRSLRRSLEESEALDPDSLPDAPSGGSELTRGLRFESLYRGLSRLSAGEVAVLRRKYYENRSFEDIGRELGLSPSGVKHRFYGALRHLRQLMIGQDGELEP